MRKTTVLLAVFASALLSLPLVTTGCGGSQGKPTTANVQPGSMPSGASWDGVYFNPIWGYLHLQQQGGNFDARWKRADESAWGEMHGTITGDIARFDWKEHKIGMVGPSATTKGRGYFRYTRPEGDNVDDRIIGQWGFDDAEVGGGEWDSVKQRNMKPDPKSILGESEATVGGWK